MYGYVVRSAPCLAHSGSPPTGHQLLHTPLPDYHRRIFGMAREGGKEKEEDARQHKRVQRAETGREPFQPNGHGITTTDLHNALSLTHVELRIDNELRRINILIKYCCGPNR